LKPLLLVIYMINVYTIQESEQKWVGFNPYSIRCPLSDYWKLISSDYPIENISIWANTTVQGNTILAVFGSSEEEIAYCTYNSSELISVYVDPSYREIGIGRYLVEIAKLQSPNLAPARVLPFKKYSDGSDTPLSKNKLTKFYQSVFAK
jgi:GNAT superfamily N-acetyltransferase